MDRATNGNTQIIHMNTPNHPKHASIFTGKRDTKNMTEISKDFEDYKRDTRRICKDGTAAPKITKTIRKQAVTKSTHTFSSRASMSARSEKMIANGAIFEDAPAWAFEHNPATEPEVALWLNIPNWQKERVAENREKAQGEKWFSALHPDIQEALLECSQQIADKYKGAGTRLSSQFGQYFMHAGGAITLLRGEVADSGKGIENCPCGNVHHKLM